MRTEYTGTHMMRVLSLVLLVGALSVEACGSEEAVKIPAPAFDQPLSVKTGVPGNLQTAVVAGGCFWGVQGVYQHLKGVKSVLSGYAGGDGSSADYESVSAGDSGHAESVQIVYDPAQVTYGQILQVFFSVAHDPTQLNRQGPDEGPQYRSAIFFNNPEQKTVAEAYIRQLSDAKVLPRRIVTTVVTLDGFYPAEPEHQDFIRRNPWNPYVLANDRPKLELLKKEFPELLKRK